MDGSPSACCLPAVCQFIAVATPVASVHRLCFTVQEITVHNSVTLLRLLCDHCLH